MMKQLTLFFFTCLLLCTACSLLGNDNSSDIPGKIVFAADDNATGESQIFTMDANGSDLQQITNFERSGPTQPSWSRDGSQIVFSSFKQGISSSPALWVMDADGSNQRVLYDPDPEDPAVFPLIGRGARWSPDGTKIVFYLCLNCQIRTNYDIYVFDIPAKTLTRLTDYLGSDTSPVWSPDGNKIAFVSDRDYPEESGTDIYLFNFKGSEIVRLTQTGNAGRPVWHRDGQNLLYWSENKLFNFNITDSKSKAIAFSLGKETGFRPLAISQDEKNILLIVFSLANPRSNQSLQILNLKNNELKKIHETTDYSGAAWFISANN